MDYVEITGYKSIKNARVEFGLINILIGANGSGKSNLISFFEFLNNVNNRKLKEYVGLRGGEEKILHKGSAVTKSINFTIEFGGGQNGYRATIQKADEGFIFTHEYLLYRGSQGWDLASFSAEANLKITDNYRAKYVIGYLNGFRKYHFHDTGRNSPFNQLSHIQNDSYFLYEKGENLCAFLFNIQQKNKLVYNRIINTIQSIA